MTEPEEKRDGAGRLILAELPDGWKLCESSKFNQQQGDELCLTHDANPSQSFATNAFSWDVARELAAFIMNEEA